MTRVCRVLFGMAAVLWAFCLPMEVTQAQSANLQDGVRTYVLVHGGWGSSKRFRPIAELLRERGHVVFTPTLSGLGERAHLAGPSLDLSVQITDIVNLIEWEDLHDVVLVGHSYSGFIISGVADRMLNRVAGLVYVDAMVPADGEAVVDHSWPGARAQLTAMRANKDYLLPMPDVMVETNLDGSRENLVPQPIETMLEPIALTGQWQAVPAKIFIRAKRNPHSAKSHDRVMGRDGWQVLELDVGHNVMRDAPRELVKILTAR